MRLASLALRSVTYRVGIVANKADLAKHVRYSLGDYGYYCSRYRSYHEVQRLKKNRGARRLKLPEFRDCFGAKRQYAQT
jgi:hypothetical protein